MISILIPTYNYNTFPLVKEIFNQIKLLGIAFEIIVFEDGSPRNETTEMNLKINEFENCIFERKENNSGRTKTRLMLSQKAKYDWLLFLDADVVPVHKNFINNYLELFNSEYKVIIGGCQYKETKIAKTSTFRYKYGKNIEAKDAKYRNSRPYNYIFSGNMLINKEVFNRNNYPGDNIYYGMDVYFSYLLFTNNIKVLHTDNPIFHLGLETNEVFFKKSLDSVITKKVLLLNLKDIDKVNSLIKYYLYLKKYHLDGFVAFGFRVIEPFLKKMILNKNPNLFCFNLYRLGYICKY